MSSLYPSQMPTRVMAEDQKTLLVDFDSMVSVQVSFCGREVEEY